MFKSIRAKKIDSEIEKIKSQLFDVDSDIKMAEVCGNTELATILYETRVILIETLQLKYERKFYVMN